MRLEGMGDGLPFASDLWPLFLFGLRLGAVALLYLFLFSAFRALRADLRPVRAEDAVTPAEPVDERPVWRPPRPVEAAPPPAARGGGRPRGIAIAALVPPAALALLLIVSGVLPLTGGSAQDLPAASEAVTTQENDNRPFGPPLVQPAPGRVTVGLAAVEPARVRVTVDGVVQFDGLLPAGERQGWEGAQRIQVWTDSGRTLLLAVNGQDLGPYSPAMGHPDWNRIDFGFWPGWGR